MFLHTLLQFFGSDLSFGVRGYALWEHFSLADNSTSEHFWLKIFFCIYLLEIIPVKNFLTKFFTERKNFQDEEFSDK
jgi:hypothetical protein